MHSAMQKALFEPGTPVFIYRLFQFSTIGLLILLMIRTFPKEDGGKSIDI